MHKNEKSNKYYWQLYKSFCKGDVRAQHELVNDLGSRLLNYLLRSCVFGNYQEAEECLQITWEKLWKYCGKPLTEEKGFWGFASKTAANNAIDLWRKEKKEKYKPKTPKNNEDKIESDFNIPGDRPDEVESKWDDDGPITYLDVNDIGEDDIFDPAFPRGTFVSQEEDYEYKQKFNIFKSMMLSLKPDDRIVMDLHLREYTNEQIAQMTGKHEQAIKTQIRTIRDKLYDKLHPESRGKQS